MAIAVIGTTANEGTCRLVERWRELGLDVQLVHPLDAHRLTPPVVAIARLDVSPNLDGIEPGLLQLLFAERRGIDVRNPVHALLASHDKLRTAWLLARAGVPHPPTRHLPPGSGLDIAPPVVLKPRYGSWGTAVRRCTTPKEIDEYFVDARATPWYRRHGVLAQAEVPSPGHDLRVLVAGGRVVGAVERVAAEGEWRTNISCGGYSRPATVSDAARELALTAAAVTDADLVGVDLLPVGESYVVVELNGAVDFDATYSFAGEDVYAAAAAALALLSAGSEPRISPRSVRDLSDARVTFAQQR